MSQQLINRSPDLKQLRDEGYDIEVRSLHLLLKSVPYVNSKKEVKRGTLVAPLGDVTGDVTHQPGDHTAFFVGEHPCHTDGSPIHQIVHSSETKTLARGVIVNHMFSAKPKPDGRYRDYHHKMTTYVSHISGPARLIDRTINAQTCVVCESADDDSPFHYPDTGPTKAGIGALSVRLEGMRIAIVGLGGTGSYVLDLVAKTPVVEIHLYDGDLFANHNAFRSPGAPSIDDLRARPMKAAYFRDVYSRMHRRVIAHDDYLDDQTVNDLRTMSFVFLCLDRGDDKRLIINHLVEWGIPFIDVGMGLELTNEKLRGKVRVTASTPEKRDHIAKWVPFSDGSTENDYSHNIQVADLNALNAALAVIKWKKLCGFYHDFDHEHCSMYTIDGNCIHNEDKT